MTGSHAIRPLESTRDEEVRLVAERMGLTLVEVLGTERAAEVHTPEEIVERLRWHLHPPAGRQAAAFVAERAGCIDGHVLVRVEPRGQAGGTLGLFATLHVHPPRRRLGLASALLRRGEAWMGDHHQLEAATYTDAGNRPLQALFEAHGYTREVLDDTWVRLWRALPP